MRWIALATVGLGIGVLVGLSVSPVLSIVLFSLVGAAATVTAIFGSFDGSRPGDASVTSQAGPRPRPEPLAVLVVTILLGAALGMTSRVNLAVGSQAARLKGLDLAPPASIAESIQAWTSLGLDRQEVTQSLFEAFLGIRGQTVEQAGARTAKAAAVGLYSTVSADECTRLRAVSDASLRTELRAGESEEVAVIADRVQDADTLRLIVKVICGQSR